MSVETPGAGDRARAALAGSRFADVRWVAGTGSTNADAMALARDGEPEGIVLVADHQTAGRGRLGRSWEAPSGASLLTSVLLRPPAVVAEAVTMATGIAMAAAVATVAGVEARLKWPNDLVVAVDGADRKLAGILAEVDPDAAPQRGRPLPPLVAEPRAIRPGFGPQPVVAGGELAEERHEQLDPVDVVAAHVVAGHQQVGQLGGDLGRPVDVDADAHDNGQPLVGRGR